MVTFNISCSSIEPTQRRVSTANADGSVHLLPGLWHGSVLGAVMGAALWSGSFFNYRTWKRMWVKSLWPLKNLQHLIAGIPTFVNLTFLGILDAVGLLNSPDERVLHFRQGSARDSFQTC